jgi:hypothetical protein
MGAAAAVTAVIAVIAVTAAAAAAAGKGIVVVVITGSVAAVAASWHVEPSLPGSLWARRLVLGGDLVLAALQRGTAAAAAVVPLLPSGYATEHVLLVEVFSLQLASVLLQTRTDHTRPRGRKSCVRNQQTEPVRVGI